MSKIGKTITLVLLILSLVLVEISAAFSIEKTFQKISQALKSKNLSMESIINIKCANNQRVLNVAFKISNTSKVNFPLKININDIGSCNCSRGVCNCSILIPPVSKDVPRFCYASRVDSNVWLIEISEETPVKVTLVTTGSLFREYLVYFKGPVKLIESLTFIMGKQLEVHCALMHLMSEGTLGNYVMYTLRPMHKLEVLSRTVCGLAASRYLAYRISAYIAAASLAIIVAALSALAVYVLKLKSRRV